MDEQAEVKVLGLVYELTPNPNKAPWNTRAIVYAEQDPIVVTQYDYDLTERGQICLTREEIANLARIAVAGTASGNIDRAASRYAKHGPSLWEG